MTKDDITRYAREAGIYETKDDAGEKLWVSDQQELERFAALVAAVEREACAKLLQSRKTGANELMDAVRDMEARVIRARGQA